MKPQQLSPRGILGRQEIHAKKKLRAAGFGPRRPRSIEFVKLFCFGVRVRSAARFYPRRFSATFLEARFWFRLPVATRFYPRRPAEPLPRSTLPDLGPGPRHGFTHAAFAAPLPGSAHSPRRSISGTVLPAAPRIDSRSSPSDSIQSRRTRFYPRRLFECEPGRGTSHSTPN